jgi:hypothetical protein
MRRYPIHEKHNTGFFRPHHALGRPYRFDRFSARTGGAHIAIVKVEIKNDKDNTTFAEVSRGPWLYADLPSGNYTVIATSKGAALQKQVTVNREGQTEARFYW